MAEDLNVSLSTKKSIRIDGDNSRIIWLDVADMNIMVRINEVYPELRTLAIEAQDKLGKTKITVSDDLNVSPLEDVSKVLTEIDAEMRKKLNYIFASEVADICEPTGNMYDVVNAEFRFEHIINVLSGLYANNVRAEYKKLAERLKKHTSKYTGRSSRRKK